MIDNSFFFKFDRSSFKSFYHSAIELNFTRAAEASGTTQSGISQHIAKLENELGTLLFIRAKGKLKITDAGRQLKNYLETIYREEQSLLDSLSIATTELKGPVTYAMPESCLMSPHFKMILEIKKEKFLKLN